MKRLLVGGPLDGQYTDMIDVNIRLRALVDQFIPMTLDPEMEMNDDDIFQTVRNDTYTTVSYILDGDKYYYEEPKQ